MSESLRFGNKNKIAMLSRIIHYKVRDFLSGILVPAIFLTFSFLIIPKTGQARLIFTGPNPFFSSSSFPQDGLLFQGTGSFVLLDHQPRGWFGNLDDPKKLPSTTYTMTDQELHLTNPTSEFSLKSNWTLNRVQGVPYFFTHNGFHVQSILNYEKEDFNLRAHGIARSYDDSLGLWEIVPFEAQVRRENTGYGFGTAIAKQFGSIPLGIRITADHKEYGEPDGYFTKTVDGVEETLNRYTWGWTTQTTCNRILAYHSNIDAWYQNNYAMARSWLINATCGTTIHENKIALRYRQFTQYADDYVYDEASETYLKDGDWTERTNTQLLRGYGLFKITKIGNADFCLVGFAESEQGWVNYVGGGVERLDCSYNKKIDFEIVPVISASLGRASFVRVGSDITWGWIGSSNTDIWGAQRVYRQSYPYEGWTPDWEVSAYSQGFYVANLSEVDAEYPIFKRPEIVLRLELWRMYQVTWNTHHFGENEDDNGIYVFQENALRDDKREETWTSGLIGVWTRFGTVFSGFFVELPISYHAILSTEVIDKEEGTLFADSRGNFPAVQIPSKFKIIFGKGW